MRTNNIVPQIKKVFQVELGSFYNGKDKSVEYYEDKNYNHTTVLAYDVFDALALTGEWILEQEKKAKEDECGVFVVAVTNITNVEIIKI